MDTKKIASIIESLLFVSGDPIAIARLSDILEISEAEVGKAVDVLEASYREENRGLTLIGKDGSLLLATRPDHAPFVERFVKSEREGTLSKPALETLSIICYRGPIGRADIEAIRGVNSSVILRNLLLRGLIDRRGNPDDARGYLYSTSFALLEALGISSASELPEYEALSKDGRLSDIFEEKEFIEPLSTV